MMVLWISLAFLGGYAFRWLAEIFEQKMLKSHKCKFDGERYTYGGMPMVRCSHPGCNISDIEPTYWEAKTKQGDDLVKRIQERIKQNQ